MSRGVRHSLSEFINVDNERLLGELTDAVSSTGIQSTRTTQIQAWKAEIAILKRCSMAWIRALQAAKDWCLILEYELPRRNKRPDVILLSKDVIFVIEFKVGAATHDASSRWQLEDYCLNLRDFHAQSSGRRIVPILCSTEAPAAAGPVPASSSLVAPILLANAEDLPEQLLFTYVLNHQLGQPTIDAQRWIDSVYRPTLSVVEAAEHLYQHHDVREISHRYASNLDATTDLLADVVRDARSNHRRYICFVTGVPGAGKTLTGLNVVHDPSLRAAGGPAGIFLSGNSPLVKVVREALVLSQQRAGRRRQESAHEVSTFIQNVHQFLRYHRENPDILPHEHVVVFDEAQRAWDRPQMSKKQGVDCSEAAELFDVMNRLDGWSVIIALVGGGQEIFLGEAGLEEWGRAAAQNPDWIVVASPEVIKGGASVSGHRLFPDGVPKGITFRPEKLAHLSVGVRSHRAQRLAEWVDALLSGDTVRAHSIVPELNEFPLYVTRDLLEAKAWLRARSHPADGQRAGLVATSEDQRLRAYGLERSSTFRQGFSFEKWFLMPPSDTRSSHVLEVAASEFECQGLELDWVGLCWGGDFTLSSRGEWEYRKFRGTRWNQVRSDEERTYVRNRYRVLLTRARLGMVIWVPPGLAHDSTLDPTRFDRVARYLEAVGVPNLNEAFQIEAVDCDASCSQRV